MSEHPLSRSRAFAQPTHPPLRAAPAPGQGVDLTQRVFLDACVLFPPLVRDLLLSAAGAGQFTPLWSARVLEEWRIASARKQDAGLASQVTEVQAAMAAQFGEGLVAPDLDLEARITLPDPADAHVLAAAVRSEALVLVTFNLRDFPRRVLADHGIEARHPDGFLWELLSQDPESMGQAIDAALARHDIAPDRARTALKRARLSRLGKAQARSE